MTPHDDMDSTAERPLVSFTLAAFNQQEFIRAAVAGALAQTYSPLEIVISDDASADRTFAIVQEMAAAYRGPHRIVLNRNEYNLGIVGNVNRLLRLSRGELVILAAGDDISLPERVAVLARAWEEGGRGPAVLYSQVRVMRRDGSFPAEDVQLVSRQETRAHVLLREWGGQITGASCALTRSLWETFGEIATELPGEDVPLTWRSALCGRFQFVPAPLVHWRMAATGNWPLSGGTQSPTEKIRALQRWVRERHAYSRQACRDVAAFPGAGWRARLAARKFRTESRCLLRGLESGAFGFCRWCLWALLLAGWPSRVMLRTIRLRFRHRCEEKRENASAGWRRFFRCYDFLRRRGMPGW